MRIAVVGSRTFNSRERVEAYVASLKPGTVVVSGGADGPDTWAEHAARRRGLEVVVHRADWATFGKRAGLLRNTLIVEDSDLVVAFWDGTSRGTADTIRKAMTRGVPVITMTEE